MVVDIMRRLLAQVRLYTLFLPYEMTRWQVKCDKQLWIFSLIMLKSIVLSIYSILPCEISKSIFNLFKWKKSAKYQRKTLSSKCPFKNNPSAYVKDYHLMTFFATSRCLNFATFLIKYLKYFAEVYAP